MRKFGLICSPCLCDLGKQYSPGMVGSGQYTPYSTLGTVSGQILLSACGHIANVQCLRVCVVEVIQLFNGFDGWKHN